MHERALQRIPRGLAEAGGGVRTAPDVVEPVPVHVLNRVHVLLEARRPVGCAVMNLNEPHRAVPARPLDSGKVVLVLSQARARLFFGLAPVPIPALAQAAVARPWVHRVGIALEEALEFPLPESAPPTAFG